MFIIHTFTDYIFLINAKKRIIIIGFSLNYPNLILTPWTYNFSTKCELYYKTFFLIAYLIKIIGTIKLIQI